MAKVTDPALGSGGQSLNPRTMNQAAPGWMGSLEAVLSLGNEERGVIVTLFYFLKKINKDIACFYTRPSKRSSFESKKCVNIIIVQSRPSWEVSGLAPGFFPAWFVLVACFSHHTPLIAYRDSLMVSHL